MKICIADFSLQDSSVPPVKLLPRDKSDSDKKNFERISEAIKGSLFSKSFIQIFTQSDFLNFFSKFPS